MLDDHAVAHADGPGGVRAGGGDRLDAVAAEAPERASDEPPPGAVPPPDPGPAAAGRPDIVGADRLDVVDPPRPGNQLLLPPRAVPVQEQRIIEEPPRPPRRDPSDVLVRTHRPGVRRAETCHSPEVDFHGPRAG